MRKIITILFLLSSVIWGQTVNFDDATKWTAGSGSISSYQTDHQYNDVISGFNVNFTGGPALRQTSSTQDGFSTTHNSSTYAWRLKNVSNVEWFVTIDATQVDGFSFYVRRWDGSPSPDFSVSVSFDGGFFYTLVGTIDNSFLGNSSDWKLFNYPTQIISSNSNIKIKISANGSTERIMIDDFSFVNPLPVELTTFSASIVNNSVELKWQTATEVNNYGFYVERKFSFAKTPWNELGFVKGHGNSNSPKEYSYIDETVENSGKYFYRLKQVDIDGQFEYSPVVEIKFGVPTKLELSQNYPNPFNPTTNISFTLPEAGNVKLAVYNLLGQKVVDLINKNMEAGFHNVTFNGSSVGGGLTSGIYIYRLETGSKVLIRKMQLVK